MTAVRRATSDVGRRTSDGIIAWVTGGGTGIGRAIAAALYNQGARVIITGRREDVLEATVREISAVGGSGAIRAISGSASDPTHITRVVREAQTQWGDITLLVNNAGSNTNRSLRTALPEEYAEVFENNCLSAIRATLAVLPSMREKNAGAIVNISSVYGQWGTSTSASYSVSKFALAGFSEALQQELVRTAVHVMTVFPGYIRTAMTEPFVKAGTLRSFLGKHPEDLAQAILNGLASRKRALYYPGYVPWVLRLHRWFPRFADRLAGRVKR